MIDKRRASAGLAAGVLLLLSAAPARAVEAACLWNDLPAGRQAAMLKTVGANGSDGAAALRLVDEADLTRWKTVCGVTVYQWGASGQALAGFVARERATRDLASKYGVEASRISAAWDDPEVRALLPGAIKDMAAPDRDPTVLPESLHALTMALYRKLGLDDGVLAVFGYSYNRVMQEIAEAR